MKKIEKLYHDEFDYIEDDNNLYEMTLNTIKKRDNKRKKIRHIYLSISSFLIVILFGIGIVYADTIATTIKSIFLRNEVKVNENGDSFNVSNLITEAYVEINQNIDLKNPECTNKRGYKGPNIDDSCFIFYEIEELEELLNVNLIESKIANKNQVLLWKVKKNNDKYATLTFKSYDIYNSYDVESNDVPKIEEYIYISTNYNSSEGIIQSFSDSVEIEEIKINSLNTSGFVVKGEKSRHLHFVANNIIYSFVISSRGRNVDDLDQELKKLIDSFE